MTVRLRHYSSILSAIPFLCMALTSPSFAAEYFTYSEIELNACNSLAKKTFADVLAEVRRPHKTLYLCEAAGIIWPIRGTALTVDAPDIVDGQYQSKDIPFHFRNQNKAAANGWQLERYNIWYSTDTQFGLRIANYTDKPVATIVVGYHAHDCGTYGQEKFEKLMAVTFNPVLPGTERVVKWNIPPDLNLTDPACMDVLRASDEK